MQFKSSKYLTKCKQIKQIITSKFKKNKNLSPIPSTPAGYKDTSAPITRLFYPIELRNSYDYDGNSLTSTLFLPDEEEMSFSDSFIFEKYRLQW